MGPSGPGRRVSLGRWGRPGGLFGAVWAARGVRFFGAAFAAMADPIDDMPGAAIPGTGR
jgi:hypothetical protein